MRTNKPTIPEVVARFAAYKELPENGAWGSLHIALDDGNVDSASVQHCRDYAAERGDIEGAELAGILLLMSETQRGKLPRKVDEWIAVHGNTWTSQLLAAFGDGKP